MYMKKFLLLIVLVLLTVVAVAQKYEYNGKKYDWKLVSDTYERQTVETLSLFREVKRSTPVDYPLTIYLSKQGDVAITGKDYSEEYHMAPSKVELYKQAIMWFLDNLSHVVIRKNRLYVSPPEDMLDVAFGRKDEFVGNKFQSLDQLNEIIAWVEGMNASKPAEKVVPVEETGEIFDVVEVLAQFPGGDAACQGWIEDNLKYPVIAQENEITGRVIVQFVVNVSGALVDVEVMKSPDPSLSKEALRLVKAMPSWRPAKIDGKPVRSRVQIPIKFSL